MQNYHNSNDIMTLYHNIIITIHAHTITVTDNHNRSASGTLPNIALYSIVGGSSIIIILSLMLVIIILSGFLKKVYRSFQM